ncbi:expressed protein [Phakopsora pachyrhizi]|uniref:Expressed protein n=1 Tax=Phakopsora pachyrhizi TaxID=170000 RepID=A0AAV0B886_PHAPC|nr:expressed protein [Phakopsora pachyrhizi]
MLYHNLFLLLVVFSHASNIICLPMFKFLYPKNSASVKGLETATESAEVSSNSKVFKDPTVTTVNPEKNSETVKGVESELGNIKQTSLKANDNFHVSKDKKITGEEYKRGSSYGPGGKLASKVWKGIVHGSKSFGRGIRTVWRYLTEAIAKVEKLKVEKHLAKKAKEAKKLEKAEKLKESKTVEVNNPEEVKKPKDVKKTEEDVKKGEEVKKAVTTDEAVKAGGKESTTSKEGTHENEAEADYHDANAYLPNEVNSRPQTGEISNPTTTTTEPVLNPAVGVKPPASP